MHWPLGSSQVLRFVTILDLDQSSRTGLSKDRLRNTKVGIIGVGSIGSKVAVSLARSGVTSFELVDGDILYAGNLVRHDGDWRDLGLHKVDAVNQRINLIQPNVKVRTWNTDLGMQQSSTSAAQIVKALKECDLIVDATAKPKVFNRLAGMA